MTSLYIDYARAMWSSDDVKQLFNNNLSEDIVSSVEEWTHTGQDGLPFKSSSFTSRTQTLFSGNGSSESMLTGFL